MIWDPRTAAGPDEFVALSRARVPDFVTAEPGLKDGPRAIFGGLRHGQRRSRYRRSKMTSPAPLPPLAIKEPRMTGTGQVQRPRRTRRSAFSSRSRPRCW
jgi:hypothetical protein